MKQAVAALAQVDPARFRQVADHVARLVRYHGMTSYDLGTGPAQTALRLILGRVPMSQNKAGPLARSNALLDKMPAIAPLWLCHPNGYYREAALSRIETLSGSPMLLALVLWRSNDWVAEVRSAAGACLERVMGEFGSEDLVPLVPMMALRAPTWKRHQRGKVRALASAGGLPAILQQDPGRSAVVSYVLSAQTGPVAKVLRRALATDGFDSALPEIATSAQSCGARHIAVTALLWGKATWSTGYIRQWGNKPLGISKRVPALQNRPLTVKPDPVPILRAALADCYPPVRLSALWWMTEAGAPEEMEPLLPDLLKDRSPSVREAAEFMFRKRAEGS